MLLTTHGQALRKHRIAGKEPHPVECDGWQFDILGSKRLRIRPKYCSCEYATCHCPGKASWMYICDGGGFWQSSFLTVIDPKNWVDPVVSSSEFGVIKAGKAHRSTADLDDDMRIYNTLENTALSRSMERLRDGFTAIDISLSPKQWFGPGQAASAWLKSRLPRSSDLLESVPSWYLDACRMSYFGGWFEQMMHGHIPGITHEYDINSAYPHIIRSLVCLEHGTYTRGEGSTYPDTEYTLIYARVWTRTPGATGSDPIGAMLHRMHDGNIIRPTCTEGWFWVPELAAAQSAGMVNGITVFSWVSYAPCNCDAPLGDVELLYQHRLSVGKDTAEGKACKLVYNSMYGKFAQSVGTPVYGNPVYASKITSGTRQMICSAIASHPLGARGVAQVATDAVFFITPHPSLSIGSALGSWSYEPRSSLTLFKPGVYWDDKTRSMLGDPDTVAKFKARGINAREFSTHLLSIDEWFSRWMDVSPRIIDTASIAEGWPYLKYRTEFSMVSCKQALARRKWFLAGTLDSDEYGPGKELVQNSNPHIKRCSSYYDPEFSVHRSNPHPPSWSERLGDWDCISRPYEKRFGLDDPFSDESRESMGLAIDGNVMDEFAWLIRDDES